jgi:hypothetical protein
MVKVSRASTDLGLSHESYVANEQVASKDWIFWTTKNKRHGPRRRRSSVERVERGMRRRKVPAGGWRRVGVTVLPSNANHYTNQKPRARRNCPRQRRPALSIHPSTSVVTSPTSHAHRTARVSLPACHGRRTDGRRTGDEAGRFRRPVHALTRDQTVRAKREK